MDHIKSILSNKQLQVSTRLRTPEQALAWEIAEYVGEPERFGLYAKLVKRAGVDKARAIFADVKQMVNIHNPAATLLWAFSAKASQKRTIS